MSPEAEVRIMRLVDEIWSAASAPGAARDEVRRRNMRNYARLIMETTVQGEVERRIGERFEAG